MNGTSAKKYSDRAHFANQIARLLSDKELQLAITRRAKDFAPKSYDPDVIAGQLLTLNNGIGSG